MQSLLSKVKKSDVIAEPFPHIVITDAIDPDICSQVISEFPSSELLTQDISNSSNQRFSYRAKDSLADKRISSLWQEFVKTNTSQSFLNEFIYLFGEHITKYYPYLQKKIGKVKNWKAGTKYIDNYTNADILLDAPISINTPVTTAPSSVIRGHVDKPAKLFAGLFYLRLPDDKSTGGDLEIYKFKNRIYGFNENRRIEDKYIELVKTVNYQSNVLVLFLNSIKSLHGVTVRSITDSPRLFLNLFGETKYPIYNLLPYRADINWVEKKFICAKSLNLSMLNNLKKVKKIIR